MCNQGQTTNATQTQQEAENRAQQINNVNYKMYFLLPESDLDYSGKIEATFNVTAIAADISNFISMDFSGERASVKTVTLNHKPVDYQFDGNKISIKSDKFPVGHNVLIIEFTHAYGNSGIGFHRTRDHADGKYYMYSNFEPFHANKAFPVFDQPDIKASYTLVVDIPKEWEAIANTLPADICCVDDQWRRWTFPTTARFSTYLFALIAGPYQKWESRTKSGVPLRLFARASMAQYVSNDVEHWFQLTDEGFKFFEKAFDYPYPFGKYDQILTPDYNIGAMENVAAVTFTEQYAFRTQVTPLQILRRAETIIHELAHMWFGNLVTMKWWDDLWLNESFATYVSNLAMSKFQEKIGTADVWQQFHAANKEWAYREDDYVTTHPIVGTAADTEEAVANFDGITYGKGASVLKQLVHFIGEDAFLQGLKRYFHDFAFKNATRSDFITALSKASGKNLIAWENEWLKTSGTNSVQVMLSQSNGQITKLVLKQFPDESDRILRTHRTELGLYDLKDGEIKLRDETISVTYSGEMTVIDAATGKPTPSFVFPNVKDYDFVHVILDSDSVNALEISLGKVSDPHLRQMLWLTLWNMVRHAKLPAQRFATIAMTNLKNETDLAVLSKGLDYLVNTSWYLNSTLKPAYQTKLEDFVSSIFEKATSGSPMQISLFYRFVGVVRSKNKLAVIAQWLNQEEILSGFKIDQERRWAIFTRLARQGIEAAPMLIQSERIRDTNDKGIISAMVAEASFPTEDNKKRWWKRILNDDKNFEALSIEKARRVMDVFHDDDATELTQFMHNQFFDILPQLTDKFPTEFNSSFSSAMYPNVCNEEMDQKVGVFLEAHQALQIAVKRSLLRMRQLHQRTLIARNLSAQEAEAKPREC